MAIIELGDPLDYLALGLVERRAIESALGRAVAERAYWQRRAGTDGQVELASLAKHLDALRGALEADVASRTTELHRRMRRTMSSAPLQGGDLGPECIEIIRRSDTGGDPLRQLVIACRSCGRWFVVAGNATQAKYCSHRCFRHGRSAAERERRRRKSLRPDEASVPCENCGRHFQPRSWHHAYCSGRCRTAACRARAKSR